MRLRKRLHLSGIEINIAPLIDVVFLLIIFFMVISQFTQIEIEALDLPEARQGDHPTDPLDRQIIINVHMDGRIMIAGTNYTLDSFGQLLQAKLTKYIATEISVLIRADQQTPWGKISEIMEVCASQAVIQVRVAVVDEVESSTTE